MSEQARLTAAVMGVPYVESELAAAATGDGAAADAAITGAVGREGAAGGEREGSGAAAQLQSDAETLREQLEVTGSNPADLAVPAFSNDDSSSSSGSSRGQAGDGSSPGFSGGRLYDSTGSADFAWGVGEVVQESGYYAYRSIEDAGNTGIGRRSSTGHRGAGDDEDTA
jgi:hypothetical protein